MTNRKSKAKAQPHNRSGSELQLHSYNQHHDQTQDLFWPEPVESFVLEASPSLEPESQPEPEPRIPRRDVVKRPPVNLIISQSSPTPVDKDNNDTALSAIIPSPLRIRKPKAPSPQLPPTPMRSVRLLIASLGNPPPYHSTRHSAGHIVLKQLANQLRLPTLSKSKDLGSGLVSSGADVGRSEYTLWQSASLMNISGQGTLKAWKAFTSLYPSSDDVVTALVVLHDELEAASGTIKLRRGESSPKGHNGIKSVQSTLKSAGLLAAMGERFIKIGVGIGRPISREKNDVSAWVLGQLTGPEKTKIEVATESLNAVLTSEIARLERL